MQGVPANRIERVDPAYDAARERVTWNKRLDKARAPDAVVSVRSVEEAAAAIRFAAASGLKVSPRGSGHHYEAAALRDGGLLLDLAGLDSIEIDAGARTARAGAGVVGGVLSERLAAHGLAFPAGHCVDVGLSGYLLAGGFGWNSGEWGAACANVFAAELVTASGEIVLATEQDHADLLWAARGAGPRLLRRHRRLSPAAARAAHGVHLAPGFLRRMRAGAGRLAQRRAPMPRTVRRKSAASSSRTRASASRR